MHRGPLDWGLSGQPRNSNSALPYDEKPVAPYHHPVLDVSLLAGILPAHLRVRGEVVLGTVAGERLHKPGDPCGDPVQRDVQLQPVPADVENGLRDNNGSGRHDIPVLQRHPGAAGGRLLLAVDSLLPCGDVHREDEDEEVLIHVDVAEDTELGLPGRVARGSGWLGPGPGSGPEVLQALQYPVDYPLPWSGPNMCVRELELSNSDVYLP